MFPANWQRTNPPNPVNECGGTDAPFDPALAEMLEARYADCRALAAMLKARCAGRLGKGPALAAMPDTRIYTKTADAFNTEDVAGDMAADESSESGE